MSTRNGLVDGFRSLAHVTAGVFLTAAVFAQAPAKPAPKPAPATGVGSPLEEFDPQNAIPERPIGPTSVFIDRCSEAEVYASTATDLAACYTRVASTSVPALVIAASSFQKNVCA